MDFSILMMHFFQLDWARACWGRWAGLGLLLAGLQALDVGIPYKKKKKEA